MSDYGFNPPSANEKDIVFPADTEDEYVVRTATFTLSTNTDPDAEDEDIKISVAVTGSPLTITGEPAKKLTIEDTQTQAYKLTYGGDDPKEGSGSFTVTLKAEPAHVDGSEMLTMQVDVPRTIASVGDESRVLNLANQSTQSIAVTLGGADGNRVDDTVTLTAYSGSAGNSTPVDTLSIDIEDINALPAVAMMVTDMAGKVDDPQPTSVTEGDTIYVVVTVLDKDGDKLLRPKRTSRSS